MFPPLQATTDVKHRLFSSKNNNPGPQQYVYAVIIRVHADLRLFIPDFFLASFHYIPQHQTCEFNGIVTSLTCMEST